MTPSRNRDVRVAQAPGEPSAPSATSDAPELTEGGCRTTVADAVISRIAQDGIQTVFGLTGGGIMYLVDAIHRSEAIQLQPVHHEEFAGVAADGYARSGRPYGVALATTGPGAAHLFTAIVAAWQDSSPVVFIVGQVKSTDSSRLSGIAIRQNGTFEFDTTGAFSQVCKSVDVVGSGEDIHRILEHSIELCTSGRPGPVVIEIPLDVQAMEIDGGDCARRSDRSLAAAASTKDEREGFASVLREALSEADRPLVLIGIGAIRAGVADDLATLLDANQIPYVVTQFARAAGRREHGLYLGSPGIKANRSANLALTECDFLLAVGTSLHQQVVGWDGGAFASLPARKVWCEPDADVLQARRSLVNEAFRLDSKSVFEVLTSILAAEASAPHSTSVGTRSVWQHRCEFLRHHGLLHYPTHVDVEGRMCLYRAVSVLSEFAGAFRAAVTDAGVAWYVLAQHYFPAPGSHYLSSGSFGAMGMALPMAIGAAFATGERVLALTGDGSLMTCLSELATLRTSGLPVVLVVNSNDGYLSIKTTHDRYFEGRRVGTDSSNGVMIPSIQELAAVFDLAFRTAGSDAELRAVLEEITHDSWQSPVVVELKAYVDQAVEPIVESKRRTDGTFHSGTLADMSPPWSHESVD